MNETGFVYVTYIRTTPEQLWQALTEPDFTERCWAQAWFEPTRQADAAWSFTTPDGRASGEVLEADPPRRLVLAWRNEPQAEGHSRVIFELEPVGSSVRLTLVHEFRKRDADLVDGIARAWPHLLASLKSLLETGAPLEAARRWPDAA